MRELTEMRNVPIGIEDLVGEGLTIRVQQSRAIVSVQIERAALTAMEAAVLRGIRWPCYPNTTAGRDPFIWWLGPERWLVSSEESRAPELIVDLRAATEGHLAAIVDISDSLTFIQLVGKAARELLARGTSLGLDDRALGPGRCARTRFANLPVLLRPLEENAYELLVDRSEAQFLLDWLRDSSLGLELSRSGTQEVAAVKGSIAAGVGEPAHRP
jgi:sarcosine oxidase, subunit gamma